MKVKSLCTLGPYPVDYTKNAENSEGNIGINCGSINNLEHTTLQKLLEINSEFLAYHIGGDMQYSVLVQY